MPRHLSWFVSCAVALVVAASVAHAQVAKALLREGDVLLPGETINFLNNTAVNHVGGYACSLSTTGTGTISRIWGNAAGGTGALLRSETTIGDLEQTAFESFYGMGDGGELSYGATSNDLVGGVTGLDGVWLDDAVVLNELEAVPSLPGQFSTFNSRPGARGDGTPVWVGGIADTQGGGTQNRCLFSGLGADVLIMGGDTLTGIADPVNTGSTGVDFDWRVSRFGTHWIDQIGVTSASTSDLVMVIDGEPIIAGGGMIREGSPVPAALGGLPGELWAGFDFLGINEDGEYLITGNTTAAASSDEFVSRNGAIVLREGATVSPGPSLTLDGAIEGGFMNEQTDWAVIWDVDDGASNREALIFNGQVVLLEGDPVDWNGDGVIDAGDNNGKLVNFTGISTLTVGARTGTTVRLYFTADIDFFGTPSSSDDLEGFFCLEVSIGCPWDCDGSVDGIVSVLDLLAVLAQYDPDAPTSCTGGSCDFNSDGCVDVLDLLKLLAHYDPAGVGCP